MKTGELLVEPVVIGLAVLATVAMMTSTTLETWLLEADLGAVALAAAAAYLVGVLFDRLADTILDRLQHCHRLKFAIEELKRFQNTAQEDPFPEDRYHLRVMESEHAWEHAYFLRSRIRLTRAILVLTPALGLSLILRVSDESDVIRIVIICFLVLTYTTATLVRASKKMRVSEELLTKQPEGNFDFPRTDALRNPKIRNWVEQRMGDSTPLVRFIFRNEPVAWSVPIAGVLILAVGFLSGRLVVAIGAATGTLILAAASGWCWWRITETFLTFLRNYSHAQTSTAQASESAKSRRASS